MRGRNATPHLARDLGSIPPRSRAWTTRCGTSLSEICGIDGSDGRGSEGLTLRHLQFTSGQIGTRALHLFGRRLGVKLFDVFRSEFGNFGRVGRAGWFEKIRNTLTPAMFHPVTITDG